MWRSRRPVCGQRKRMQRWIVGELCHRPSCPSWWPAICSFPCIPRMVEIIQLLGSSSLMALPTEADFTSPIAPDLERYLETDTRTARERAKLFHLAWDVACS